MCLVPTLHRVYLSRCMCCLCGLSSRAAGRDGRVMLVGNRSEGLELDQRVFFKTGLKIGLKPLICVNETQWDLRYIVGRLVKL